MAFSFDICFKCIYLCTPPDNLQSQTISGLDFDGQIQLGLNDAHQYV